MSEPTIMICIGAPKAGTTWLYGYLSAHPDCHFRAVKEIHYFDWRGKAYKRGPYYRRKAASAERLRARAGTGPIWRRSRHRPLLATLDEWFALHETPRDPENAAYRAFLLGGREDQRVVGDITPSYMEADRDGFAEMARLGPDVRFVFLMRDPVDRLWSAVRMKSARREGEDNVTSETATAHFDAFMARPDGPLLGQSDYARTLRELTAAVAPEKIHCAFYEDLFRQDSIDALTRFLGIAPHRADFDEVKNSGAPVRLDPARRLDAFRLLREQYAFCDDHFAGHLPERWRTHMTEA